MGRPRVVAAIPIYIVAVVTVLSLIMVSAPARAAPIAYSNSGKCTTGAGTATSCVITMTINAGETVVVAVGNNGIVSGVTDSGGSTYVFRFTKIQVIKLEVWTTNAGLAKASVSLTVTMTAAARFTAMAAAYTNVRYMSANYSIASAATNNPSVTSTAIEAASWAVTGIARTGLAATIQHGTLRQDNANVGNAGSLVDNSAAAPGPVITSVTTTSATQWAAGAVLLTPIPAPPPPSGPSGGLIFFLLVLVAAVSAIVTALMRR